MKKPFDKGRAKVARPLRVLSLTYALLSLGCAAEPGDPAASPSPPGDIDIATPITLTPRARVPEKEPGFVSAEVRPDELLLEHDGSLAAFTAGDVLGGTQGGGYLVQVMSARALDATHIALATAPASLTDLIAEGEFHVHYDPAQVALRAPLPGALTLAPRAPLRLLDLAGAWLPASCGVHGDGEASLDVTAELSPEIDLDLKIGPRGVWNRAPEIKRFRLVASGRLDVDATLEGAGTIRGACSIDLLELAGGALHVPLPTLTFWAGPVPIVVTTEVVPTAQADLKMSISAGSVAAEARTSIELLAGAVYEDKEWSTIWDPSGEARGEAELKAPGAITASCKVSAGAELRARLYGVLGPSIGVQAYAQATAGSAPPYCTYDGHIDGGVDAYARADAGVSVGPLDLTLASLDLVNLELVHFKGPRFSGELFDGPRCGAEP